MEENDLNEFKNILLAKREAILHNNQEHHARMKIVRENSLGDEADFAAIQMTNVLEGSIFRQHYQDLEYINQALKKIEEGGYGICEMCDEPIGIERLKAKPYAKYCIVCREIVEKNQKETK
ncbi:MAG: RNA polymerase-binding protein DksA [Helicobacter sp.]|nr:RNA polymerase-binding protein DksA [Helicobacter sp.]